MQIEKSELSDHITLGLLSPILNNVNKMNFKGKTAHPSETMFNVYTLAPDVPAHIGEMTLRTKTAQDTFSLLTFHSRQNMLDGHIHEVRATVHYDNTTPLCVPRQWDYTVDMKDPLGRSLKHTHLEKKAVVDHGVVVVKSNKTTRKLPVDGVFTISWLLFEAVRHLPKDAHEKYKFTMFDHFDQVKKDQLLYYCKSIEANFNGTSMILHAFDHIGNGIVPWVYWVDEHGRLLCAISGIEAYVLVS
jgi:hypothetical protein